jgi:hypothetical protein
LCSWSKIAVTEVVAEEVVVAEEEEVVVAEEEEEGEVALDNRPLSPVINSPRTVQACSHSPSRVASL